MIKFIAGGYTSDVNNMNDKKAIDILKRWGPRSKGLTKTPSPCCIKRADYKI